MSVEQARRELLCPEEECAVLPLRAKWEKELASLEHQLTALTNRKSELTRMLASLNGIIPPKDDGQGTFAGAPLPQRPASRTAPAVNPIPEQHQAGGGGKKFTAGGADWRPTLQRPRDPRGEGPAGAGGGLFA